MRQDLYELEAVCPHCRGRCLYNLACSGKQSGIIGQHQVFCSHCHRRYILDAVGAISTGDNPLHDWLAGQESQVEAELCAPRMPFLSGSYDGYNFVNYKQKIYAIPLSLGVFDITAKDSRSHPEVLEIDRFDLLNRLIDYKKGMIRSTEQDHANPM